MTATRTASSSSRRGVATRTRPTGGYTATCRFLMSFRTTSTGMPRIARRRELVRTLIPHDLEYGVDERSIAVEHRLHRIPNFALFEAIAAPIRLLHRANCLVERQRRALSGGRAGADFGHRAELTEHTFKAGHVLKIVEQGAEGCGVDPKRVGPLRRR